MVAEKRDKETGHELTKLRDQLVVTSDLTLKAAASTEAVEQQIEAAVDLTREVGKTLEG